VTTAEVPGAPDQVDLNVGGQGKAHRQHQRWVAGFSSAEKARADLRMKQENAFGSGNYLGVELNTSKYNRTVWSAPPIPISRPGRHVAHGGRCITAPIKPYSRTRAATTAGDHGRRHEVGVPFSELDTVFFWHERLLSGRRSSRNQHPGLRIWTMPRSFGYPSNGLPADHSAGRAIPRQRPGAELRALPALQRGVGCIRRCALCQGQLPVPAVHPAEQAVHAGVQWEVGWGKGLGGRPFPVFKNFYAGGLGSVRGFDQSTLGPRDVTGAFIGGTRKFVLNTEFITHSRAPAMTARCACSASSTPGTLYGEGEKIRRRSALRYSTGVGMSWISPPRAAALCLCHPPAQEAGR
jgi:outer membrane protein insertion porin family